MTLCESWERKPIQISGIRSENNRALSRPLCSPLPLLAIVADYLQRANRPERRYQPHKLGSLVQLQGSATTFPGKPRMIAFLAPWKKPVASAMVNLGQGAGCRGAFNPRNGACYPEMCREGLLQ